jgi:hypothetical protein
LEVPPDWPYLAKKEKRTVNPLGVNSPDQSSPNKVTSVRANGEAFQEINYRLASDNFTAGKTKVPEGYVKNSRKHFLF